MEKVYPGLRDEIRKLGGSDLQACYSCGNCSAVCPLSEGEASFPRRMIRYSMLGLEKKILASPEPWLCYYCGECTETCPREADPGGLMMALRRFAIRKYSVGRIADLFYSTFRSGIAWIALTLLMTVLIILFHEPDMNLVEVDFLSFLSLEKIHNAGVAFGVFLTLAFGANVFNMVRAMRRSNPQEKKTIVQLAASFTATMKEVMGQRRFVKCEGDRYRYWAHMGIFWGFAGMFLATVLVMGIDYEYFRISRAIPFVLGSVFGIFTLAGTIYFLYLRLSKKTPSFSRSHQSDYIFLILIILSVASGYVMVMFKYLQMPMAAYISFAFHIVMVFDLLVSLPFTKFAHMIYRPIAIWISGMK